MPDALTSTAGFLELLQTVVHYPIFTFGSASVTLAATGKFLLVVLFVFLLERIFRRYVLQRALKRTTLDPSLQFAVLKITGYLFLILGLYIAFQAVGVDLSSLAVLAGAIGVGLGFGLQNIINNFISGIIILAERPIALGDRIEVGGVAGQVRKISLRSTTIVTNDNIAIIVPNSNFISETVINWSHGDPTVRLRLPIGVAYGSDTAKVRRVLLQVAAENPSVLKEPPPSVFFDNFGDSSLNFELAVWTSEMTLSPRRFRSQLNFAIDQALRENGIEIPFPQRDLHIRSGVLQVRQPDSAPATPQATD